MGLMAIILAIISVGGLVAIASYLTSEIARDYINGTIIFLIEFFKTIPEIYNIVVTLGGYLFSFIGFFLTHIPFMFAMTQIFFIFISMNSTPKYGKNKSFNMINVYFKYNIKLFNFLINLFLKFISLIVAVARAIGNYIPFT